jgi:hypothetical protein
LSGDRLSRESFVERSGVLPMGDPQNTLVGVSPAIPPRDGCAGRYIGGRREASDSPSA